MNDRGQVAMVAALTLPVLLGMTGMAIDVGTYASDRRQLQNAADSIALAAAQELPDESAAVAAAHQWATRNGISLSDLTLTIDTTTTGGSAPYARATIDRQHDFAFVKVVGIDSKDVSARAAASKVSFGGSNGIVPWTVTQATQDAATLGGEVIMKYDADGANIGNFGAIRIDGPGANTYNTSVKFGSTAYACAATAPNCTTGACPGVYPEQCAETAPECDGPDCTPQTGNLIGPTATGVDFRINNTMPECDTFDEVFSTPDPITGKSNIDPDCNPWTDGPGKCTSDTDICSRRVIIIPVVDSFGSGASDPATIQRFALMFLEGYDDGKCQGNSCEIKGRFVSADINTRALAGSYDEDALIHFVRLSE
ncbi:MAG TPA: Tad domain-containing protein [Dehalococcoidia bacterium]|nr:Tad domain-containing protein [Dehalococcoidia bacterium]